MGKYELLYILGCKSFPISRNRGWKRIIFAFRNFTNEPNNSRFLLPVKGTSHNARCSQLLPLYEMNCFHNVICNSHSWLFHIPGRRIYTNSWMNTCVTDRMQNRVFPTGWRLVSSPLWQINSQQTDCKSNFLVVEQVRTGYVQWCTDGGGGSNTASPTRNSEGPPK